MLISSMRCSLSSASWASSLDAIWSLAMASASWNLRQSTSLERFLDWSWNLRHSLWRSSMAASAAASSAARSLLPSVLLAVTPCELPADITGLRSCKFFLGLFFGCGLLPTDPVPSGCR